MCNVYTIHSIDNNQHNQQYWQNVNHVKIK